MTARKSRRDFLKEAAAVTAVAHTGVGHAFAQGRVLGANDRINVGFVGCGGRMNTHIDYIVKRAKEKGDVQAVAICDIYERRKTAAATRAGVESKNVHHDFR